MLKKQCTFLSKYKFAEDERARERKERDNNCIRRHELKIKQEHVTKKRGEKTGEKTDCMMMIRKNDYEGKSRKDQRVKRNRAKERIIIRTKATATTTTVTTGGKERLKETKVSFKETIIEKNRGKHL